MNFVNAVVSGTGADGPMIERGQWRLSVARPPSNGQCRLLALFGSAAAKSPVVASTLISSALRAGIEPNEVTIGSLMAL
jgi:hypothetical protein